MIVADDNTALTTKHTNNTKRMVTILNSRAIRAPALPCVLVLLSLASTDGKAGARIKMLRHFGLEAFDQLEFDMLQVGNGDLLAVGQR